MLAYENEVYVLAGKTPFVYLPGRQHGRGDAVTSSLSLGHPCAALRREQLREVLEDLTGVFVVVLVRGAATY